jgi:hypothetical protein
MLRLILTFTIRQFYCSTSPVHYFSRVATILNVPGPHNHGFTMSFRHTTLGENLLVEWSTCRRGFYLTRHNTDKGPTSIPPAEFEPVLSASERPQFHALDRATPGIGDYSAYRRVILCHVSFEGINLVLDNIQKFLWLPAIPYSSVSSSQWDIQLNNMFFLCYLTVLLSITLVKTTLTHKS